MGHRFLTPRGLALLGLMGLLSVGFATIPGATSIAQQAGKVSGNKALRSKMIALSGEVALLEVEHEAEREILKQKLMREPIVDQQILKLRSEVKSAAPVAPFDDFDSKAKDQFLVLAREIGSDDASIERLSKALDEAVKAKDFEAFRRATLKWMEGAEVWAKAAIDKELAPLRRDFVRHTSDLIAMKLDLEDLERQYRESR